MKKKEIHEKIEALKYRRLHARTWQEKWAIDEELRKLGNKLFRHGYCKKSKNN